VGSVLSQLVAPATVVAVSPFSVIAAVILVLHTDRPRANGLAFLVGRVIALASVTAVFVQAPRLLGDLDRPIPPRALFVAGAVCVGFGVWVWLRRDRMTEEPRWLRRINGITPPGAGAIGIVLVVSNPKMLAASAAAGLLIGTADFGSGPIGIAGGGVAYYALVASSTVAVPVLAYVAVGTRADDHLTRLRLWLHRNSGVVSAVILLAVGVVLIAAGSQGL
jgi:hypothetical protein